VKPDDMIFASTFEAKSKLNKSESFLKIINDESNMFSEAFNEKFYVIRKWIEDKLELIKPTTRYRSNKTNDTHLKKITSIIKEFDTGISDIYLSDVSLEEVKKILPDELLEDIIDDADKKAEKGDSRNSFTLNFSPYYYIIDIENGEIKSIKELKFNHHGKGCEFRYFEESDGTKRLFDILDILLSAEGKVFIVDELERSLHPRLTKRFIELFLEKNKGKESQLIFTTHETYIMSLELFRQDEVWFVEKNDDGYSSLYSLNEYKERYDKKIDKAYLEGRYGAVPVFKGLGVGV
ncbi:MAG: AAA family ATPase, partial [Acidaminobacteraceae bacterium]